MIVRCPMMMVAVIRYGEPVWTEDVLNVEGQPIPIYITRRYHGFDMELQFTAVGLIWSEVNLNRVDPALHENRS